MNMFYTTYSVGHPHNSLIQLWTELGVAGVIFGIAFALLLLWRAANCQDIWRRLPWDVGGGA